MSDPQTILAHWLAGAFDNESQAQSQPVWFVHLRLWYRPLPFRVAGNLAFFAEQSNVLYLNTPYRQRVMVLQTNSGQLRAQYFALKQPDQFRGAGANPKLLSTLSPADLELLPGCTLRITRQITRQITSDQGCFRGEPEPDTKCCFHYDGKTRQVVLGFEVSQKQFLSFDRGVDPETGKALWGALVGAYEFDKCEDFGAELPSLVP